MQRFLLPAWRYYRDKPLILKMTVGFFLGLAVALLFGPSAEVLAPLGEILLHLLQMIVIPIIMLTLIDALAHTGSGSVARIAGKTFVYYIATTTVAVLIGLALALLVSPGAGLERPGSDVSAPEAPAFMDQLLAIFPSNIFQALVDNQILALIFVALIVGIALAGMCRSQDAAIAEQGASLGKLVQAAKEVTFRILDGVLQYAPLGVFALVASQLGNQGGQALLALGKLTGVLYAGIALQILLVYIPLLLLFRVAIVRFFRDCRDAIATAFITQSSSGTIPVSMHAAQQAGIMDKVAGFVIPIGATVNMDGAVIRYGASVVLAANIVGHVFSFPELALLVVTATLVSIGTAGVPGAGLVGLTILLTQAGLPIDIVALVAGVDVVLGMGATMLNVTGDLVGAHIIDRSELRHAQPAAQTSAEESSARAS
ncbi:MAG TPA: dicarboxylate/amino acid:cation symporter [Salinisphaeraceae bacterium]|nr:dicarboxylate/amino acid:cation symporter [Salinisphaeraceae bacterium]